MNGCKPVNFSFSDGYLMNDCELHSSPYQSYTTSYYVNLRQLNYNVIDNSEGYLRICKYDLNKKFVSFTSINSKNLSLGNNTISLDENYLYRFSYAKSRFDNFQGYQCNVGIGSMANELAFGKLTFLDEIGTIIPFVIPLIAFALGFLLLKKMIKRGNKGNA